MAVSTEYFSGPIYVPVLSHTEIKRRLVNYFGEQADISVIRLTGRLSIYLISVGISAEARVALQLVYQDIFRDIVAVVARGRVLVLGQES